jgi:hypothetical protein
MIWERHAFLESPRNATYMTPEQSATPVTMFSDPTTMVQVRSLSTTSLTHLIHRPICQTRGEAVVA